MASLKSILFKKYFCKQVAWYANVIKTTIHQHCNDSHEIVNGCINRACNTKPHKVGLIFKYRIRWNIIIYICRILSISVGRRFVGYLEQNDLELKIAIYNYMVWQLKIRMFWFFNLLNVKRCKCQRTHNNAVLLSTI